MKPFLSFLVLTTSFILLCSCRNTINKQTLKSNHFVKPSITILDSLQGTWCFMDYDQGHNTFNVCKDIQMIIHGRSLTQINIDTAKTDNQSSTKFFTIYFSDTLVNKYLTMLSTDIKIDTFARTGNFLIKIDVSDNTVWCYTINGLYTDSTGITFSLSNTWAHGHADVYIKQPINKGKRF